MDAFYSCIDINKKKKTILYTTEYTACLQNRYAYSLSTQRPIQYTCLRILLAKYKTRPNLK